MTACWNSPSDFFLSKSSWLSYLFCPYEFYLRYIKGVEIELPAATWYGLAYHDIMDRVIDIIRYEYDTTGYEVLDEWIFNTHLWESNSPEPIKTYTEIKIDDYVNKLIGKIDRIDIYKDGTLRILEYKTNTKYKFPKNELLFYYILYFGDTEVRDNVVLACYNPRHNIYETMKPTKKLLNNVWKSINTVKNKISEGDFNPNTYRCKHCVYSGVCDYGMP